MPELPEVINVVDSLRPSITDLVIRGLTVKDPGVLKSPSDHISRLPNRLVTMVENRGKYILISVEDGVTIVVHLAMAGKLLYQPSTLASGISPQHVRFRLDFTNDHSLYFHDHRHFGSLRLLETSGLDENPVFKRMGPQANTVTEDEFTARLALPRFTKKTIKEVLMDQSFIAGVGNIYASEILFWSEVRPSSLVAHLSSLDIGFIYGSTIGVLDSAIAVGGCSIQDYVNGNGEKGSFQEHLTVYGREGEECLREGCGGVIENIEIKERSSFFCPKCQILRE